MLRTVARHQPKREHTILKTSARAQAVSLIAASWRHLSRAESARANL